jgi:hypothetical protein
MRITSTRRNTTAAGRLTSPTPQLSVVETTLLNSPDLLEQQSANGVDSGQADAVQVKCNPARFGRQLTERQILDYAILLDLGGAGMDDIDP